MKKSIGLLSALVVSTTFIVNCQKAPDKRRVRPSGGAQTDVVAEKAKLPTKVCSAELLTNYRAFHKSQDLLRKTVITAASTEAEKESQKKLGVETLAKCDDLIKQLQTEDNQGCYLDNGVKDTSNALMAPAMQNLCNSLGKKLKTEVELDSSYADAAKENEKAKEDAKKVESDLIGKSLVMSKEARALVLQNNTDGGKFLVDGEIRSSNSSLDTALAASQTVCTFLGEGLVIKEEIEASLKIVSTSAAEKADLAALKADFTGKSTLLSTEISQEETKETISLLCLNLDAAKLSVAGIKKALGTGIASAAVQVATEVTGGTSSTASSATTIVSGTVGVSGTPAVSATAFTANDLAAKQPAGSPQAQNLASGTAQMIADANKVTAQKASEQQAAADKKAADKKAKEEQAAADKLAAEKAEAAKVTVVTAQSASGASTTVTAKEVAEDAKGQLEMLKEKAERLEAEAVAAETEVKKLEAEKAKAESIDEAKAKARITRESANSAKAEYETAAKAPATTITT